MLRQLSLRGALGPSPAAALREVVGLPPLHVVEVLVLTQVLGREGEGAESTGVAGDAARDAGACGGLSLGVGGRRSGDALCRRHGRGCTPRPEGLPHRFPQALRLVPVNCSHDLQKHTSLNSGPTADPRGFHCAHRRGRKEGNEPRCTCVTWR